VVMRATNRDREPAGDRGTVQGAGGGREPDETREPIILPVPIIDLQPLASTTDLRLFLANSLRQVMEATSAPAPPQPKWGPDASRWPSDDGTDVREAWEKFRDVAALGSDHVHTRRARLDAATYAVELEQAESNRQVAHVFGEFMNALREAALRSELTRWGEYRPLFVVPIDDADMNPRLGAQLIETVNLLSHDDLAYLITGDTELFLLLLREHLAGGFRHSLRSVDLESDDTTDIGDLIHLRSLAHQVYDKHIPHAHRCRIDPLPGSKRVEELADWLRKVSGDFEQLPAETFIGPPPNVPPSAVGVGGATSTRTLAYYFDLPEPGAKKRQRTGATEGFTDPALPETMRGLEDTREMIDWRIESRGSTGMSAMAEVVRYFWRDRINGSLLRGNDRRDLLDVVRLEESDVRSDAPGAPDLSTEKFAVQNTRLHREIISRTLLAGEFGREHRWALREILDYEFRLHGDARAAEPGAAAEFLLPSGVGGALILATDVAADLPTGTFIGKALSPEEFYAPFVVTSVFSRKEGEYFEFPWPMPDWDSFRDFHIFSRAWGRVVSKLSRASIGAGRLLDHLLYPFIALVASVWYDRHGTHGTPPSRFAEMVDTWAPPSLKENSYAVNGAQLADLTKAISDELMRSPAHRRDQDFRHWYHNRLMLLAAPESGLSAPVANLLYDALRRVRSARDRRRTAAQRRFEFDQTAIGARIARANQARIGGGKETGIPIRTFYAGSIDVHVDDLLTQIDESLGRFSAEEYLYPLHDPGAREAAPPARSSRRRTAAPSVPTEPAE
jgi:hypothetical protein